MKLKVIIASAVTVLASMTALSSTASARGPNVDVDVNIGLPLPPPPHIIIGGGGHRDHDRYDRHDRRDHRRHDHGRHAPRGYWKEVVVKVWVPGGWTTTCDRYGREIRVRERGHYAYRTNRVWVDGDRHGRRY